VAERLAKALAIPVQAIELARTDLPDEDGEGPGECWNFDQIEEAALRKAEQT
jgi:hypothetical protein